MSLTRLNRVLQPFCRRLSYGMVLITTYPSTPSFLSPFLSTIMNRVPKPRTSAADRLTSRGFSSETLQSRVEELQGLKVFQIIAKPTQDAHNSMRCRLCEYLALLDDAKYTPDEVLAHGAPHLPLSMYLHFLGFCPYLIILSQTS